MYFKVLNENADCFEELEATEACELIGMPFKENSPLTPEHSTKDYVGAEWKDYYSGRTLPILR